MTTPPSRPAVCSVAVDASARDAAREMERWHVGFLVAVDEAGRAVGVLTDRDLALRVLCDRKNPSATRVVDIMTSPVVSLPVGADLADASRTMREGGIRKLPIVDAQGRPEAVVTADDVVLSLGERIQTLAEAVRRGLRNEARPPASGSALFGKE